MILECCYIFIQMEAKKNSKEKSLGFLCDILSNKTINNKIFNSK